MKKYFKFYLLWGLSIINMLLSLGTLICVIVLPPLLLLLIPEVFGCIYTVRWAIQEVKGEKVKRYFETAIENANNQAYQLWYRAKEQTDSTLQAAQAQAQKIESQAKEVLDSANGQSDEILRLANAKLSEANAVAEERVKDMIEAAQQQSGNLLEEARQQAKQILMQAQAEAYNVTIQAKEELVDSQKRLESSKSEYMRYFQPVKRIKLVLDEELNKIDSMIDGHQFEHYFANLLRTVGYRNVLVTQGSGDFGVDVIAEHNKVKYAFQCKRYSQNVGVSAVQEVFSGVSHYHCHVGVVVTNTEFTAQAIEHAAQVGIVLWNRNDLIELLKEASAGAVPNGEEANQEFMIYDTVEEAQTAPFLSSNTSDGDTMPHDSANTVEQISDVAEYASSLPPYITAGEYIFGVDLPCGRYNLKALRGSGDLYLYRKGKTSWDISENFGAQEDDDFYISEYRNLRGDPGDRLIISGVSQTEICRSPEIARLEKI